MKRNIVIAIIIIVLFLVLALVGYAIYAIQNRVSLFAKREKDLDEEEADTEEEKENSPETKPAFLKGHRRQRTGTRVGSVQDRITSFESLNKQPEEARPSTITASTRPSTAPEPRRKGDITPPFLFPTTAGRGQLNKFKPGDELELQHKLVNMVRTRSNRLSAISCSQDEPDLAIDNNELLTMSTPRVRGTGHARSQTVPAVAPRRDITTAAAVMHEPECHDYHGHSRSQSTVTPTQSTPSSRSPSPSRFVPANTHTTMFPSAFRSIAITDQQHPRPSSSGSMSSSSTVSDTCPPTPTSIGANNRNSWFSWASPFSSHKPSPPPSPTLQISPAHGSTLSPLKPDSDDWGFFVPKRGAGVGDHWADTTRTTANTTSLAKGRTISKQIRWDDEESVRYSWF
ncbi:hypothetical protein PMZ80_005825 [Knufia obscura]|uniref:Uncharacterized protein n=2 Tax=Knufia TaxID=430999 RepID=A0AAN8EMS6_9EURO|nr:hypothetical protein PMZ80_005825 [Knufia obscura]KAK5954492.1 hypothetical protein OHC33_004214 [Knufia fluminis]